MMLREMDIDYFTIQRQKLLNISKYDERKFKLRLHQRISELNKTKIIDLDQLKQMPNKLRNERYWRFETTMSEQTIRAIEEYKGVLRARNKQQAFIDYNLELIRMLERFEQAMEQPGDTKQNAKMQHELNISLKLNVLEDVAGKLNERYMPKGYALARKFQKLYQDFEDKMESVRHQDREHMD